MEEENIYSRLTANIAKYKKNRENVPLSELKTKYGVPYEKLKAAIAGDLRTAVISVMVIGCRIRKKDAAEADTFKKAANKIVDEEWNGHGVGKEVAAAVFKEYDLEKALTIACIKIHTRIWYEAYAPYWLTHCKKDGDRITNDIIGMTWDPEHQLWEKTEDGRKSVTIMLPPTLEECEAEKKKEEEENANREK